MDLILTAILNIATADPDAFDHLRVEDEGIEYVCSEPYSKELTKLCKQWQESKK